MTNRTQERFDEARQRMVGVAVSAGVDPAVVIRAAILVEVAEHRRLTRNELPVQLGF